MLFMASRNRSLRIADPCDQRGVTAVEFALIAPVFLVIVIGLIEISIAMFAWVTMEAAVREVSRFGITGNTNTGETREQTITRLITQYARGILDTNLLTITTLTYAQLDQIGMPEPLTVDLNHNGRYDPGDSYTDVNGNGQWDADMGATGVGNAGQVVLYRVSYPWRMLTPFGRKLFPNQGQFMLSATMVVRNEPYDYAGAGG